MPKIRRTILSVVAYALTSKEPLWILYVFPQSPHCIHTQIFFFVPFQQLILKLL